MADLYSHYMIETLEIISRSPNLINPSPALNIVSNVKLPSWWETLQSTARLPALHYSVDFIFLPFGIMGFIVELRNY